MSIQSIYYNLQKYSVSSTIPKMHQKGKKMTEEEQKRQVNEIEQKIQDCIDEIEFLEDKLEEVWQTDIE